MPDQNRIILVSDNRYSRIILNPVEFCGIRAGISSDQISGTIYTINSGVNWRDQNRRIHYPVLGYPKQSYTIKSGENWPYQNRIIKLPDIRCNLTL